MSRSGQPPDLKKYMDKKLQNSFHDSRRRVGNNKENSSHQGCNDPRVQKERQTEWARSGRVLNRNTNKGDYFRNSLPGITREFRVVKDNRQKAVGDPVPESFHNGDPSNGQIAPNIGEKSSTEKLPAQRHLATHNSSGHGAIQADNRHTIVVQVHDKEFKPSTDQKREQSDGMITTIVGSHAALRKGNQNRVLAVPSGSNNFTGELCCSPSDPIHVPSPGSRSPGTFGAIKREVGVVGARQRPTDNAVTNTSASNSSVKVPLTTATKDNASNGQQSRLSSVSLKNSRASSSIQLNSRPSSLSQYYSKPSTPPVSHSKVHPQLEWKPKSISPSSVNHHADNVAPSTAAPSVDGHQAHMAGLSKKLSQANVSEDEHVIIPAHLRVPDSERTHLIFGNFACDIGLKAFTSASDTSSDKELNASASLTSLNSVRSTDDMPPTDQTDPVGSSTILPNADSIVPISEHQHPLTEDMGVLSPGVIREHRTNDMISNKVMDFNPGVNQLSVPVASQQPVPQMYQHMHVPQYPNCLPYRHVFSPYYAPPVALQNYSNNPSFTQLPHASSYLVMPNGTSQLAPNGMKYGPHHQYKQVFPGGPAGYGSCANQNGYPPINTGVIGTGTVEDSNMSKYKDNNLYTHNPQAETADVWIQGHTDIPVMQSVPFYNMMGQPVSPHTAYLPAHNGHNPFSPVQHPAHLQFPALPHPLQPTTMTMVQNPQPMVHQPAAPPLAGNIGIDMAAMASGAQVGAFQQNQLSHLGWAPPNF